MQRDVRKKHLPVRRNKFVLYCTVWFSRICLSMFHKLEVAGRENVPLDNAFILLPKHQRWTDIPFIAMAAPVPLYYVAKHELFSNRLSNWFISSLGGLPLNRTRPIESRRSLNALIQFLHQGEGVVVFPEGTYYRDQMGPGNIGIIRLILTRFALPFVPVGISYNKGRFRTRVRVVFGKPIHVERDKNTGKPFMPPQEFLEEVMLEIAKLSGLEKNIK